MTVGELRLLLSQCDSDQQVHFFFGTEDRLVAIRTIATALGPWITFDKKEKLNEHSAEQQEDFERRCKIPPGFR